jgi:hypothetical protein
LRDRAAAQGRSEKVLTLSGISVSGAPGWIRTLTFNLFFDTFSHVVPELHEAAAEKVDKCYY